MYILFLPRVGQFANGKNIIYHSIHDMSNTLSHKGHHDDRTEYAAQLYVTCRDDIKFNLSR
jgi:hypothetical protein